MDDNNYFDSQEYQDSIAKGYSERIAIISPEEVVDVLEILGFSNVAPDSLQPASGGNIHATYLTPELVVKLNPDRSGFAYYANKFVSDRLAGQAPIVRTLAYDPFVKTKYEVLVMQRSPGTLLQTDVFKLSSTDQQILFRQILRVTKQLSKITFNDFGEIGLNDPSYTTYGDFLMSEFRENVATIRKKQLVDESALQRAEVYFERNAGVFDMDTAVFVHADLHMGNILHDGSKLTSIIDFDHSQKAPAMVELVRILGTIGYPQQFVEGRPDFSKYKGKNFFHLLPVLKEELPELLADPALLQKLNALYVSASISLIAEDWDAKGNQALMHDLLSHELPESSTELKQTFYGRTLRGE